MSLALSDELAGAVAVAPRVSLADIESKIVAEHVFRADEALAAMGHPVPQNLKVLTICILVMRNGFSVVGTSAPASAANFNAEVGVQAAREDAIRQIWRLEGYALRERLAAGGAQ